MKAAVWHARGDVRVEEVPDPPTPPAGQLKIEVSRCGICGTDLHEYLGGPIYIPADKPHPLTGARAPVILGHEMSGTVIEVGQGVKRMRAGDRVALCPIIGCLECVWCRSGRMGVCPKVAFLGVSWHGGGFARYVNVHEYMCHHLPPEVSFDVGALVEPFAATVRAIKRSQLKPGESVAIVGAGPIGLMALQAARIAGAKTVVSVEPAAGRQEIARMCGAAGVVDPASADPVKRIRELTGGDGADVVVECAGLDKTGMLAGRIAGTAGRIVVMGVFERPALLDYTDAVYGEKTVIGSMGGYGVFDEAIGMMAAGSFRGDLLITKKIPLADIVEQGFRSLIDHKEDNVKVLVTLDT